MRKRKSNKAVVSDKFLGDEDESFEISRDRKPNWKFESKLQHILNELVQKGIISSEMTTSDIRASHRREFEIFDQFTDDVLRKHLVYARKYMTPLPEKSSIMSPSKRILFDDDSEVRISKCSSSSMAQAQGQVETTTNFERQVQMSGYPVLFGLYSVEEDSTGPEKFVVTILLPQGVSSSRDFVSSMKPMN